MGNWILRWNFDKQSYNPGGSALVGFWLENTGDKDLFLSELKLEFDFGTYNLERVSGAIPPKANSFLGNVTLLLPNNVIGRKMFRIKYHIYEQLDSSWVDLGYYLSDRQYFINVYPTPLYKVFISRGLNIEDRAIGDPMVEIIREWSFETVTIGIEVKVPDEQITQKVKEEVEKADALIAIATPRFFDALTGLWRTLEWLHGEVGIAYGIDKPLLILKDRRASLGGLPSYLENQKQALVIEFDPYNLGELRTKISSVMPAFREWIETKRRQEFVETLGKIAIIGTIAIVSGIIGMLAGSSKR